MKTIVLDEHQRSFLKNYERMSIGELDTELKGCKTGSLSWEYCQMELQRRIGQIKIVSPGDVLDS